MSFRATRALFLALPLLLAWIRSTQLFGIVLSKESHIPISPLSPADSLVHHNCGKDYPKASIKPWKVDLTIWSPRSRASRRGVPNNRLYSITAPPALTLCGAWRVAAPVIQHFGLFGKTMPCTPSSAPITSYPRMPRSRLCLGDPD